MTRYLVLAATLLAVAIGVTMSPRIPQDDAYHHFADRRPVAGIPNGLNVLSNLPFAVVGIAGLIATFRRTTQFEVAWERLPYAALFAGIALTALGSSYYHLAPDNARLVWDRLPMTIGFMAFLTATVAERIALRTARAIFFPALLFGAASVGYWYWTELQGAGDLRPYLLVQFGSLMAIGLMLALYRSRYSRGDLVVAGLAAYALAKVFELADAAILDLVGIVSGHSLKHLAAAAGVTFLVAAIVRRAPARSPRDTPRPASEVIRR